MIKSISAFAITTFITIPALAEETRQLDAHEHGVGQLDIAFEGRKIAMEFHAPGADIVGFEYAAETASDRAAVDAAVAKLATPLSLFQISDAAGCSVVQASASLESEDDHDAHHEDEGHDDHGHEDHAESGHHDHDDHDHDEHAEAGHDDHEGGENHTEFHAEYLLDCADPSAVTEITFAYFETFPNALEVEVQIISDAGASAFEVERDAPTLDLRGMF